MGLSEHTVKQFDVDLENIRSLVLQMGGLVEHQIQAAMEVLQTGNMNLADKVIADDHRVNALEVGIDEDISHIIARRQPAAVDLRMIMTVVKSITDLERIGDEAEKIAHRAKALHQQDRLQIPRFNEVRHLANLALEMLRMSLDAFARLDVAMAAEAVKRDKQVDEEFSSILRQLITFMMEDPRTITSCLEIMFVAKAIERIGDHAKNISEYVVYMVKGKDVRHVTIEEMEREVAQ